MKHYLILWFFAIFESLSSEDLNSFENRQVGILSVDVNPDHKPPPILSNQLHSLAKNISHSKGIYRENGDIRRSVLNKAIISSGSDAIKQILQAFDSSKNKLELLRHLEYLVHQYDVAVHFCELKGLKIISPLLFSSDNKIVSSVASVLGAAMQSNPTVQKIALEENIGRKLFYLLSHNSPEVVQRILFALSAFLRNSPEGLKDFLLYNGVFKFKDIFENTNFTVSTKLKIVSLVSDLAIELETCQHEQKAAIQRLFIDELQKWGICKFVIQFLDLENYNTHEKTLSAMVSLQDICYISFKNLGILDRLNRLVRRYSSNDPVYRNIDADLKMPLEHDMTILFWKFLIYPMSYPNNTFFDNLNQCHLRDEL